MTCMVNFSTPNGIELQSKNNPKLSFFVGDQELQIFNWTDNISRNYTTLYAVSSITSYAILRIV